MKIIGLTGGIGSGKSTVADMFAELGVPVYNSDEEAKKIMESSEVVKNGIIELFGRTAYNGNKLNKSFISDQVFQNKDVLKKLNAIVHPAVRNHFLSWMKNQDAPYVIQEAAIIFENGKEAFYDAIILVVASLNARLKRVMKRDGISKSQIMMRIDNQWPDERKIPLSDFVIDNKARSNTLKKVQEIHLALLDNSAVE
ncbi:MAG: dephospho-CoA kinase [Flavobacteriaceae bacterium]